MSVGSLSALFLATSTLFVSQENDDLPENVSRNIFLNFFYSSESDNGNQGEQHLCHILKSSGRFPVKFSNKIGNCTQLIIS